METGSGFASLIPMSRVEPVDDRRQHPRRETQPRRSQPRVGHTPGKAEGEESDVDEALRRATLPEAERE
jgi:hypothetical protein